LSAELFVNNQATVRGGGLLLWSESTATTYPWQLRCINITIQNRALDTYKRRRLRVIEYSVASVNLRD